MYTHLSDSPLRFFIARLSYTPKSSVASITKVPSSLYREAAVLTNRVLYCYVNDEKEDTGTRSDVCTRRSTRTSNAPAKILEVNRAASSVGKSQFTIRTGAKKDSNMTDMPSDALQRAQAKSTMY